MALPIKLNPDLELDQAAAFYSDHDYAAVDTVLNVPDARRLHKAASECQTYNLVTVIEGLHRDFLSYEMERLDPTRKATFDALVTREAQAGFCYLYDQFNLYEGGRKGLLADPVLRAAYALITSGTFLDLGRKITGVPDISFADCQLTRFRPGHFLTAHDDARADRDRVAAYVLHVTQDWCADYGGVLQILDETGDVKTGLTPMFNRLTVLKVPQPHAVSVVSPFAQGARLAITGWFQRGEEPAL